MMAFLHLKPEMRLLSVRSSDIAFTMSVKGPLLERRRSWTVRYRSFEKSKACEQAFTGCSHDRAFPMVCSKESGTPCMTAAYAVMHSIF